MVTDSDEIRRFLLGGDAYVRVKDLCTALENVIEAQIVSGLLSAAACTHQVLEVVKDLLG